MKESYILTIKAEDRPGLIHLVTGMIERQQTAIKSLNAAPTDVHDIVAITIEVMISERALASLALKLEKIIEVNSVKAAKYDQVICLRVAYFKLSKAFLENPQKSALQKYGAVIINWSTDTLLVAGYGSDITIRHLYNELEGPHLLGFTQTGLISDTALMDDAEGRVMDEDRINRLAA